MQERSVKAGPAAVFLGGMRTVARWRLSLCAIAALNIALWSVAAVVVMRGAEAYGQAATIACRWQVILSAAYVFGCAFRSVFPVYDIPRTVLVDSTVSSVFIGRSVATVAELAFAAQWALALHRIAAFSHSSLALAVSLCLVPMIAVAEVCSWHAVLTTKQLGHIFENSLWGLAAAAMVASLWAIGSHQLYGLYPPLITWCIVGAVYAIFMFIADVPMYWSRWRADQQERRPYLGLAQGAADALRRRIVSYRWDDWKSEVSWMTLYFSVGVWSSVSLIYTALDLHTH